MGGGEVAKPSDLLLSTWKAVTYQQTLLFFPFIDCPSSSNSWGRSRNGEYGKMLLEEKGVGGERGVDRDVRCAGEAFGLGNA